jgi:hypothetical protein
MVETRSSVAVIARSVIGPTHPRRTISPAILVGSSRDRVAIQRRAACDHDRANLVSTIQMDRE